MDAVAEVKSRLNIEDVISEYVQLKRTGRNFKGISPWTNEKTASFIVSPEKQIWHDFSSGKGGDMFSFVMEVEGLDFRGTLELLARKAGVDLDQFKGATPGASTQLKNQALAVLELTAKFYQKQLTVNKTALEYLTKQRGFSRETIFAWKLGYAPNTGFALTNFLTKHGFTTDDMKRAGVTFQRARHSSDMFRGRIMIPLADANGQIIGFTARLLAKDDDAPKYINTPQTITYDKSRNVFGLHMAKESVRKEGFVVVAEGNLDVIASWQAGVPNVVASAGTAMTEEHLKTLKRFTGDVRLSFDADRAGVAATERVIPLAQKIGVSLKIITINDPDAKDPDELIRKDVNFWNQAIEQAQYAPDWLIDQYKHQVDLSTAAGKKIFTDALLTTIRRLSDPIEQEHYLKLIAKLTDTSLGAVQAKFSRQPETIAPLKRQKTSGSAIDKAQVEYQRLQDHFLSMVLLQPKIRILTANLAPEIFTLGPPRELFNILQKYPEFPKGVEGSKTLHLDAMQGAGEQRTEAYLAYVEAAAQAATPQSAKNLGLKDSLAGSGAKVVQSLRDYVKIIVLQFEELYQDLPLADLEEQAAKLKHSLIKRYVKIQNHKLAIAMQNAKDDNELNSLVKKADKLNELIKH